MKLMLVDDERLVRESMRALLKQLYPDAQVSDYGRAKTALEMLETERPAPDVALLDIEMPGLDGLALARAFGDAAPKTKIIFVTAHAQHAVSAFKLHVSGYLVKPVKPEELKAEIDHAVAPQADSKAPCVHLQTFGNFEALVNRKPLAFSRSKAKELLAYLTDRAGAGVTTAQIACMLWEDSPYSRSRQNQTQSIISSLLRSLKQAGVENIVRRQWNSISLDTDRVSCDYYDLLRGEEGARRSYTGEYMHQYSWAEETVAALWKKYFI